MTGTIADSATHRLATVPAGGPLAGQAVAVPRSSVGHAATGLMTLRAGRETISAAVRVIPLDAVPPNAVAVGDDLTGEWDLDIEQAEWTLTRAEPVPVRALTLELPTERDPDDASKDIITAGLDGELLWIPSNADDMVIRVASLPHRVRSVDVDGRTGVVGQITRDTRIGLHTSAVRTGADIVILADCSKSMAVDDLPIGGESLWGLARSGSWITRMQALQQALRELLDMRLQISGRVSRLALVEFNHRTRQLFPRAGGMAQLDGSSPAKDVEEFRDGIAHLYPSGATQIGNALHEAADLLYQHGRVGNEKLIVLVSDGADWKPKGEQGSGEMVDAVMEPVSLMAHLHDNVNIRLHAIGISTRELFRSRGYRDEPSVTPNHELLEELVKVGGGDPTAIGGLDVLERYFSGLGTGVTHRVRGRLQTRAEAGPLPRPTADALARLATRGTENWERQCSELSLQLLDEVGKCNQEAVRALGTSLWDDHQVDALCTRDLKTAATDGKRLARILENSAHTLRPPSSARHLAAAERLLRVLDELVSEQSDAAPAETQVNAIRQMHHGIAALHESLRGLPDNRPPADSPTGWVLRD